MNKMPCWEVYAIRYASADRTVHSNFLHPTQLIDGPMQLDFYIWAAICGDQAIIIDTGFNARSSARRNRRWDCDPTEALRSLGLDPQQICDVVITHLHYDHAGNLDRFPASRFHVQEEEMRYATGPCMCDNLQQHFFEAEDICTAVSKLYAGRLHFHQVNSDIAAGVTVHHVGGHTAGLQVVRIHTARGWIVLASDATHYYANHAQLNPFPAIYNEMQMLKGYQRLDELADSREHIIPGHDPEVLRIYPRHPNSEGLDIACLHETPINSPTLFQDKR